jgi:hypothetical protein
MEQAPLSYADPDAPGQAPPRSAATWALLIVVWAVGLAVWAGYIALFIWALAWLFR